MFKTQRDCHIDQAAVETPVKDGEISKDKVVQLATHKQWWSYLAECVNACSGFYGSEFSKHVVIAHFWARLHWLLGSAGPSNWML